MHLQRQEEEHKLANMAVIENTSFASVLAARECIQHICSTNKNTMCFGEKH